MNLKPKTVKEIQSHFLNSLSLQYDEEEIRNFIFLTFEHLLNFNRMDLQLKSDVLLNEHYVEQINAIVTGLKEEKPIQYLLGSCEFYGLNFFVNEHVLIPRQETEELVNWVLQDFKQSSSPLSMLDIGTGSGCIAIAVKKNLPAVHLSAYDISLDALNTARKNADRNEVQIDFQQIDILNPDTAIKEEKRFDVIISNPPYVLASESKFMAANVLNHEPHLALFVQDKNPLLFYEAIATFAQQRLKQGGWLYFEINEAMAKAMQAMLELKGFLAIETRKDMNGRDRMMKAIKN